MSTHVLLMENSDITSTFNHPLSHYPTLVVFVNPRHACAARVTVVVLCVCMYVCMCVCVSTHTYRLTHWNRKREIPTDSAQYRERFNFCRFS